MVDQLTAENFQNGCFHLHVKDGQIHNGFSHMTLPDGEYILHMKLDNVYSPQAFISSHPHDADELKMEPSKLIFNLAGNSIVAKE